MQLPEPQTVEITPHSGSWTARHARQRCGGPDQLQAGADVLLENSRCYVDDMLDNSLVIKHFRDFRRAGNMVVEVDGYFPFGQQIKLRQVCQYAANHLRVTVDWNWPRDTVVRRHLGVGSLNLPGPWRRMYVVPPATHLADGIAPAWQAITMPADATAAPLMIGHWHRPPLVLVFERADGTSLEIGTGIDLWRWQHAFGHGPESASIKVFATAAGIELIREPLMCCQEFMPAKRQYRFSWYAAWRLGKAKAVAAAPEPELLVIDPEHGLTAPALARVAAQVPVAIDFRAAWPPHWQHAASATDFVQNIRRATPCWQSAFQKHARRVIRQLAATSAGGNVVFRGLTPSICWDPTHLQRRQGHDDGIAHWDLPALLEFATWARKTLGPAWQLRADLDEPWQQLPSMQQLFMANGFESVTP